MSTIDIDLCEGPGPVSGIERWDHPREEVAFRRDIGPYRRNDPGSAEGDFRRAREHDWLRRWRRRSGYSSQRGSASRTYRRETGPRGESGSAQARDMSRSREQVRSIRSVQSGSGSTAGTGIPQPAPAPGSPRTNHTLHSRLRCGSATTPESIRCFRRVGRHDRPWAVGPADEFYRYGPLGRPALARRGDQPDGRRRGSRTCRHTGSAR